VYGTVRGRQTVTTPDATDPEAAGTRESTMGMARTGTRVCCSTTRGGGPARGLGYTTGIGCTRGQTLRTTLMGTVWWRTGVMKYGVSTNTQVRGST